MIEGENALMIYFEPQNAFVVEYLQIAKFCCQVSIQYRQCLSLHLTSRQDNQVAGSYRKKNQTWTAHHLYSYLQQNLSFFLL